MKTAEVKAVLRGKFCAPEWSIFFEVADGTGMNQRRWADAVAMNMYPSRGMEIHGFEIKVSRSDWLRELKNPDKSMTVQQYCDRWWIVAPKEIIKPGELPPTWGHYDVTQSGIRQIVAAPKLSPIPVTKSFMAAMLRRAGGIDEDAVRAAVNSAVEKAREGDQRNIDYQIEARTNQASEAIKKLEEFETLTGMSLSGWGATEDLAKAVNLVQATGLLKTWGGISQLMKSAETFAAQAKAALDQFPMPEDGKG